MELNPNNDNNPLHKIIVLENNNIEQYGNIKFNLIKYNGSNLHYGVVLHGVNEVSYPIIVYRILENDINPFMEGIYKVYDLLHKKPSPYILQMIENYKVITNDVPDGRVIVFPNMKGGNLQKVLNTHGPMSVQHACHMLVQILTAVAHCHMHGIALRNITIGNIFFLDEQRQHAILADITKSHIVNYNPDHPEKALVINRLGALEYIAPEVFMIREFDAFAADIYALGVVFFITLSKRYPFIANTVDSMKQKVCFGEINWPENLPPHILTLLRSMMTRDPNRRPTAATILNYPFIRELIINEGIPIAGQPMSGVVNPIENAQNNNKELRLINNIA
jgi:serine/threonine protein kinase